MSSKQKKQQRRKGKKRKTSRNTKSKNTKSKNIKSKNIKSKNSKKVKKKTNYNKNSKKSVEKKAKAKVDDGRVYKQLSLSPFYSFSNHWSYITRQYLCLSTWGTCMGGINEQYDDLLDQEASHPLVEENYKRAITKWEQQKNNIEKYNRDNQDKYQQIKDEKLNQAYNISNDNNEYNTYNVFNYPMQKNYYPIQQQQQQYTPPPHIQPMPKQFAVAKQQIIYSQQHRCPEYSYIANNPIINVANVANTNAINTENIYNTYNTYNTYNNDIEMDEEETLYNDTENSYNKPSNVKYDKAANIEQNSTQSGHNVETNESSISRSSDNSNSNNSNNNEPLLQKKQFESPDANYLASPAQKTVDPAHIKGAQSFGRKFSMFEEATQMKRRKTMEEVEWKKQHHSGSDETGDRKFNASDNNGVQYIEQFTFHPAAHHIQPHVPRKVSNRDFAKHMDKYKDKSAVITDDKVATLPAKDKIKLFSMLSAEQNLPK